MTLRKLKNVMAVFDVITSAVRNRTDTGPVGREPQDEGEQQRKTKDNHGETGLDRDYARS